MRQTICLSSPGKPAVLPRALRARGRDGDVYIIRIRRAVHNTEPAPRMLKKFIPVVSTIQQEDRCNAKTGHGQVTLRVEGFAGTVFCETTAIVRDDTTELRHDWDIHCSLPMIGGAIERFLASDLTQKMEEEATAGRPLLAQYA